MGGGDFELRHWRPPSRPKSIIIPDSLHLDPLTTPPPSSYNGGYTSLAGLITSPPSAADVNSPSAAEIRIRNRLVKYAAYAYLQPTPSSTETRRRRCRCCSLRRALAAVGSCFTWLLNLIRMDSKP